jgi:hypothetical protein
MRRTAKPDELAEALRAVLVSPNECDSNLEPANVVDALFAAGRIVNYGLKAVAAADNSARNATGLLELARAVDRLAAAVAGTMQ